MLPPNSSRSSVAGYVWVPVMHFYAYPIHDTVHWRVGRRLGSCKNIIFISLAYISHAFVIKKYSLSLKLQDILNQDISMVILKYVKI